MENASKALIIAGAILLSILIIAIGMYIYNSSQNTVTNVTSQFGDTEIQTFNQQFTMYEGKQSGTNVKALLGKVIASNSQNAQADLNTRLVGVDANNANLSSTVTKRNTSENAWGGPESNTLSTIRSDIKPRHEYTVTIINGPDGFVEKIIIKY